MSPHKGWPCCDLCTPCTVLVCTQMLAVPWWQALPFCISPGASPKAHSRTGAVWGGNWVSRALAALPLSPEHKYQRPVHSCLLMQLWLLYRAHTRLQLRKSQDPARGPQSQWPLLAILTVWGGCVLCLEQKRGTADNDLGVWPQQLSLCFATLVLPQQETLWGGRVTL